MGLVSWKNAPVGLKYLPQSSDCRKALIPVNRIREMCRERQGCKETKVGVNSGTMRDGDAEAPASQTGEGDEQIR